MLIRELFEDVGKNDYHPESFYAKTVADFINDEGVANWPDIYAYVELMLSDQFTGADKANVPSRNNKRWKIAVNNLYQHRTLEGGRYGDIVRIKGGFATREAAKNQNIPIAPDNNEPTRNPGNRDPQYIKKMIGVVVNTAYKELGSPKLTDVQNTRNEIEHMVKMDPWLDNAELINKAKDIITNNII